MFVVGLLFIFLVLTNCVYKLMLKKTCLQKQEENKQLKILLQTKKEGIMKTY